jgi:5-methylcytosine-specific restriction protein A
MKLANTVGRATEEWVGATPDTPIPPRVHDRVYLRFDGICQCGCGMKIRVGERDTDHKQALINGGENRESNLVPIIRAHHKKKTAEDVAIKAKTARIRQKNLRIKTKKSRPIPGSRGSGIRIPMNGPAYKDPNW